MTDIFNYLEYREYLRDYYQEQKRGKTFFSYRFIGHKVGMDSSYVIKVLKGSLHISPRKIGSFVELLNLDESQGAYFETLVHFCRAKSEHQRKIYFEKLFAISSIKARQLDAHHYGFFRKWFYPTIWSIINCAPFQGNFRFLARQCHPPVTVAEAREAVKLLEKIGLVEKDAAGSYRTQERNLTTGRKWHSYVIKNYQLEMARLARESIERDDKKDRDVSTVSLCIDERRMPEIQEHIRQFRSSLIKMINSHGGSGRVYQMNVQLFPTSASLEKKP